MEEQEKVNYGLYVGNGKTWSLNECCYLLAGLQPYRIHVDKSGKYTKEQQKKVHEISFLMQGKKYEGLNNLIPITPPPEPNRDGKYDPLAIIKWALITGLIDVPNPLADWCKARLEIPLDDNPLSTETTSQESPINQQSLTESEITRLTNELTKQFGIVPKLGDLCGTDGVLKISIQQARRNFHAGKYPFAYKENDGREAPILINLKALAEYLTLKSQK